ncbi:MAG: NAD(P)/FAD-dependent oxidoreductase [Clostridia bacterium]
MKVVVIGGGPSGMMAAGTAAFFGAEVTLIEKNEKLGKKLYITGKGRCNLTNTDTKEEFIKCVATNPKFLYSAISEMDTGAVYKFFEDLGLKLKVERGGRVFPLSDKASDVTAALERYLKKGNVEIMIGACVKGLNQDKNGLVVSVSTTKGEIYCDKVILATGGMTYSSTGSTGDGYVLSKRLGHNIITPKPSLCAIKTKQVYALQGLTLKNVNVKLMVGNKVEAEEFGELLFTHEGVSGPTILSISATATKMDLSKARIVIDLKPALTEEELDLRLIRDFKEYSNKQFKNALGDLLPQSMIPVIVELSNINPLIYINSVTAEQRKSLLRLLKHFSLDILAMSDIDTAVVTSGGVDVKQIKPNTMQSKIVENVYFAGELIDVDGLTGGYNIQIALSTGYLAGKIAGIN